MTGLQGCWLWPLGARAPPLERLGAGGRASSRGQSRLALGERPEQSIAVAKMLAKPAKTLSVPWRAEPPRGPVEAGHRIVPSLAILCAVIGFSLKKGFGSSGLVHPGGAEVSPSRLWAADRQVPPRLCSLPHGVGGLGGVA